MEILKACQAYEHSCSASPGWSTSRPRQLIQALATATTQRLPGYADVPWEWERPDRHGPAVGYGTDWRPQIDGLTWIGLVEVVGQWMTARMIVITLEATASLPADLTSKSAVFVVAHREVADDIWDAVVQLQPEAIGFYPTCRPWLVAQLSAVSTLTSAGRGSAEDWAGNAPLC